MIFVVEAAAWWGAMIGVWITTLSSVTWPEVWIAAAAALPCAVMTVLARRALADRWRPNLRSLRWLAVVPVAVVADTVRVLALPLRAAGAQPRKRDLLRIRLPDAGEEPRAATARAEATVLVSATPATVVLDSQPDEHTLVVHRLVSGAPDMTKVVSR
jgi:multisubunit Na+/H+ antiporter MnhE subunit